MHVEASEALPQAYMTDSVTRLFEVYEVVEQITLVFCSVVLRPRLKPALYSASSSSALTLSRLKVTRNMILLGWLIRLMVR